MLFSHVHRPCYCSPDVVPLHGHGTPWPSHPPLEDWLPRSSPALVSLASTYSVTYIGHHIVRGFLWLTLTTIHNWLLSSSFTFLVSPLSHPLPPHFPSLQLHTVGLTHCHWAWCIVQCWLPAVAHGHCIHLSPYNRGSQWNSATRSQIRRLICNP